LSLSITMSGFLSGLSGRFGRFLQGGGCLDNRWSGRLAIGLLRRLIGCRSGLLGCRLGWIA
jgi:hypothetical protein